MHVPRGLTGCTKPPCEQPKPVTESRPPPLLAGDCALLFAPSPAGGPHSNPQRLCHADAAVRGVCGAGRVRHLQVQKVRVPLHGPPPSLPPSFSPTGPEALAAVMCTPRAQQ